MRFYNTAAELLSAVDACPPLLSLMAIDPVNVRPTANRKVWIIEGHIAADCGRKKIQQQLSEFASNVSLHPASKNGLFACKLNLHAASQNLVESVVMAYTRSYRMNLYNQQIKDDIERGAKPENYSSFPPERFFTNARMIKYRKNGPDRVQARFMSFDPTALSAPKPEAPALAPSPPSNNVTPFPGVTKTPQNEKPGT
ncbi:MAG: hypothetical protein EON60_09320 [Alphaproteobacteria bacterium]|nr:MAG: hypothetical protein EON60_09320 [Alphaproteobacteria bacterium]